MKKKLILTAILAGLTWAFQSFAQKTIEFEAPQIISSESYRMVTSSHINNDQLTDLCAAGGGWNAQAPNYNVTTFPQAGNGLITGQNSPYPAVSFGARSIASGDLNSDNLDDLAIIYADSVLIYLNSSGVEVSDTTINVGATAFCVQMGDLNSDGLTDVAVSTLNGIALLYQNPAGHFFFQNYTYNGNGGILSGFGELAISDLNNDGSNDLVWFCHNTQFLNIVVAVIYQTNDTLATPHYLYGPTDGSAVCFMVGEIDDSPGPDITVAYSQPGFGSPGRIAVWSSQYYNQCIYPTSFINCNYCPQVMVNADMNNDGLTDIIAIYNTYQATVLLQNENGFFWENVFPVLTNLTYNSGSLAVGDYNNDGLMDIACADIYQGLIVLYQATTTGAAELGSRKLKIYPNPFSGLINIGTETPGELEVYNQCGQKLVAKRLSAGSNRYDFSWLTPGHYVMRVGQSQILMLKR